jgi:hypothetical protein
MFKFKCDNCGYEFDVYNDNVTQLTCTNCGKVFTKKTKSQQSNVVNNLNNVTNNSQPAQEFNHQRLINEANKSYKEFKMFLVIMIVIVIATIAHACSDTSSSSKTSKSTNTYNSSSSSSSNNKSNSSSSNKSYSSGSNNSSSSSSSNYSNGVTSSSNTSSSNTDSSSESSSTTSENVVIVTDSDKYNSEYLFVTLEDMDNNNQSIVGKKVVCVGTVGEVDASKSQIQVSVPDTVHYADFYLASDASTDIDTLSRGTIVALIGIVGDETDCYFFTSSNVYDCYIIASGTSSYDYRQTESDSSLKELFNTVSSSSSSSSSYTSDSSLSEEDFKAACKKFGASDYESILRNPDNYKKVKAQLSGTVDQIIEGWFDCYTLYITDSAGNKWGTTYYYKDGESHKLEGDSITVWGNLDGTKNVDTLLGKQVTIPYIDVEYIK